MGAAIIPEDKTVIIDVVAATLDVDGGTVIPASRKRL